MFTGRIEEVGEITSVTGERIVVCAPESAGRVPAGGSLNVAGVCVTVEYVADGMVTATVSAETRRRTTFDRCGSATPNPRWRCAWPRACPPVGVCCEVMNPDGTMAGPADLEAAALRWGLPLVDVSDLRAWL
jgi:hypothetical protein